MPRSENSEAVSASHPGVAQTGAKKRARRKRDPERTREIILEAAREVLAQDGKEGLSVAVVAQRAGVNRGTAYQHFQTREQLIDATVAWVSDSLYRAVFGDPNVVAEQPAAGVHIDSEGIEGLNNRLVAFAMENPALVRVWLYEVLSSKRPSSDPFWRQYASNFERFSQTKLAQPGLDVEVVSVLFLAGAFMWPVWVRGHSKTAKDRKEMAERYAREILRLGLHGTLRPERYPDLVERVGRRKR